MHESGANEQVGKAKRVMGMFVSMLGSGIILESTAFWTGSLLALAGLATFIWGLVEARPPVTMTVRTDEDGQAITPSGKSL